jgi:hypothetical protein
MFNYHVRPSSTLPLVSFLSQLRFDGNLQAIRDELARKVADLSSQNESMKKVRRFAPCCCIQRQKPCSIKLVQTVQCGFNYSIWCVQEKDMVMQEYLSLKEANKQLKQQADPSLSLSLFL